MRTALQNEKQKGVPGELSCGTKNKKACHENCLTERKAENRAMKTILRNEK